MTTKHIGYTPSDTVANANLDTLATGVSNALGQSTAASAAAAAATAAAAAATAAAAAALYGFVINVKNPAYAGGAKGDNVTDDTVAIQAALAAGPNVYFPPGRYRCVGLLQTMNGQVLFGDGGGWPGVSGAALIKNGNGVILASSGNNVQIRGLTFRGELSVPVFTGHNVTFTGDDCAMINSGSRWAFGRAVKATGNHFQIRGGNSDVYQTADATAGGFDIEIGVSGTATIYHELHGVYSSQNTGGILMTDVGSHHIIGGQFGKLSILTGTGPAGVNGGMTMGARILGAVTIGISGATLTGNQFGAVAIVFLAATSGCTLDLSNVLAVGHTISNLGNQGNNLIIRNVGTGAPARYQIRYGDDTSPSVTLDIDPSNGDVRVSAGSLILPNNRNLVLQGTAPGVDGTLQMSATNKLALTNAAAADVQIVAANGGVQVSPVAGQKIGLYGVGPVVQQQATIGTGITVDQLIAKLQASGLLKN